MKLFHRGHRLFLSILGSIFLHCLAIAVVQKYSVWYYAYARMMKPKEMMVLEEEKSKKYLLKTTFRKISQRNPSAQEKYLVPIHEPNPIQLQTVCVEKPSEKAEEVSKMFDLNKVLKQYRSEHLIIGLQTQPGNTLQTIVNRFQSPQIFEKFKDIPSDSTQLLSRFEVKPDEIEDLYLATEGSEGPHFKSTYASIHLSSNEKILDIEPISISESTTNYTTATQEIQTKDIQETKTQNASSTLPFLPNLKSLKTRSISECFETDIVYTKSSVSDEYIFAITFIPNPNTEFQKLKQNFHFLMDRNNSIQARRLHATSHAIIRALSYVPKGDQFNVIAYDSKVEKFSSYPQEAKTKNIKQAKHFLMNQKIASFFTESNLFKTLRTLSIDQKETSDLNTIILFTDGETLNQRHKDMFTISHWLGLSKKKVSLFTISLNEDRNLPLLNLLSEMSQGKLCLAQNKKAVKRKLIKLMQSISYPIATDVTTSAIAIAPDSIIKLYPSNHRQSNLYQSMPFVLIGTTKKLEDFILFVQGKHKNEWLNLKKTISFKNAKNVGENLEQQWVLQKAFDLFESFMMDGNPQHLKQANEMLHTKNIHTPFP